MKISHRLLYLSLLLGAGHSGMGQTVSAPSPDDSLKGKIWTATARRIWADTKPPQPQPAAWPTVEAFEDWRLATPADKSELGLLRGDVIKSIGTGTKATPQQVAQVILTEISRRQQSKKGRLTRLKLTELKTTLATLTQPKALATNPQPADSTALAAPVPAAAPPTVAEDQHPRPEPAAAPPARDYTVTEGEPRYFGLPPTLAGLLLLVIGGTAGIGLARALRSSSRNRRRHHDHPTSAELDATAIMNSQEYRKLHKQNENLSTQLKRLRQELDELKKQLSGVPAAPTKKAPSLKLPPPIAAAPLPPQELSIEELVGAPAEAPTASAPAATRYGPVQETPFVEERKIVDMPLPQLALMLTVNPRNPDQATFTLNPQVDQARLIGDGLTRLQKFFDYDPPIGGRITSVAAVKAGKLERHDNGWQVVERARLLIS
ncbi:hypothetical protein [Hymenobacter sp. BRD67]|uniref:hypothetical protein n=1 Tax=Hymenobacter sp. BRD67 TaxID=2675877 RepID=UPI0015655D7E|nr:hypothetical protein [Hymenobacter sp. BRD67]QKG53885.1 hypothetical protein GKZ67_16350 [Hymenobacter sp. BRD67]